MPPSSAETWLNVLPYEPKIFLVLAGVMYMLDTCAHFLLPNYADYAELFLMAVAVPSILGEMSMAVWLLVKGGFTVNQGR
ncbi:MAG: DUF4386 family protein [Oceanobacter sp.]